MSDPRIAVLVVLDEPQGEQYYGGTIAAPVVGKITVIPLDILIKGMMI